MQALSFAVHIPLVCFGIAFPALVLFAEWLYLRTGDPLYLTLARRWSKVMIALFAVGVVTGTILSFELGTAVAELHGARSATCSGSASRSRASRSSSRRSSSRSTSTAGTGCRRGRTCSPASRSCRRDHRLADGDRGQRLDEPPGGFRLVDGEAVDVHPWTALFGNDFLWHELVHMYVAGYIVIGFLRRRLYAWGWLRGRRGRYERTALAVAADAAARRRAGAARRRRLGGARRSPTHQPVKLAAFEGLGHDREGRADPHPRLVRRTGRSSTGSRSRTCSRCSPSTTRTRR